MLRHPKPCRTCNRRKMAPRGRKLLLAIGILLAQQPILYSGKIGREGGGEQIHPRTQNFNPAGGGGGKCCA